MSEYEYVMLPPGEGTEYVSDKERIHELEQHVKALRHHVSNLEQRFEALERELRARIIAGSRHIKNRTLVIATILRCPWWHEITCVISGRAPGVDRIGEEWARTAKIPVKPMPADWDNLNAPGAIIEQHPVTGKLYNRRAGPDRNRRMAECADALILIWDGKSEGSANMLMEASKRGLRIWQGRL